MTSSERPIATVARMTGAIYAAAPRSGNRLTRMPRIEPTACVPLTARGGVSGRPIRVSHPEAAVHNSNHAELLVSQDQSCDHLEPALPAKLPGVRNCDF